jgi:hypothetical protein
MEVEDKTMVVVNNLDEEAILLLNVCLNSQVD